MANNSNIWDLPGQPWQSFRSGMPQNGINNSNFIRGPPHGNSSMLNTPLGRVPVAPPLPQRPTNYNNYTSGYHPATSFINNSYGGYGGFGYGYGSYRPFSSFGYGYGTGGYYGSANPESRFIQMAEESSRPAFQAIQSVLHAFSSVAMMFDSTFNALYSSYMSVIGVADNFGKLRSTFGEIFSVFAVFKALHLIFRKCLYLLGLSKNNPETEALWLKAFKNANGIMNGCEKQKNKRAWLTILLFCAILGGPYLLFKQLSRIYPNPLQEPWDPQQNPGSLAVGMYDFHSSNDQELSFSANQKLMIAPEKFQPQNAPGWLLACDERMKIGLIPHNYIGMMMQSEKTGKTYVEYNGQKFQPVSDASRPFTLNTNESEGGAGPSSRRISETIVAPTQSAMQEPVTDQSNSVQ